MYKYHQMVLEAIRSQVTPEELTKLMAEAMPKLFDGKTLITRVCIGSRWVEYRNGEWREY